MTFSDFLAEDLFENTLFMTNNEPFINEYKVWKDTGINCVVDIMDKDLNNFVPKVSLKITKKICNITD